MHGNRESLLARSIMHSELTIASVAMFGSRNPRVHVFLVCSLTLLISSRCSQSPTPYNIAAAFSPARWPYSSAEPQCCAPFSSEWPIATRP